jgi:hypothetical protein
MHRLVPGSQHKTAGNDLKCARKKQLVSQTGIACSDAGGSAESGPLPPAVSPIELALIGSVDDPRACASDSYAKPLDTVFDVVVGKRVAFGTHAYRKLGFANTQTMEILDRGPATAAINQQLAKDLDRSPEAAAAFIDARRKASLPLARNRRSPESPMVSRMCRWTPAKALSIANEWNVFTSRLACNPSGTAPIRVRRY